MPICSSFLESLGRIVACPGYASVLVMSPVRTPNRGVGKRTSYTLPIHIKGRFFAPVLVRLDVDHLSRVGIIEDNVDVDRSREEVGHLGWLLLASIGMRLYNDSGSDLKLVVVDGGDLLFAS